MPQRDMPNDGDENDRSTAKSTFQSGPRQWISKVLDEVGIAAVLQSPFDAKLLILQRLVRFFAFGASTLILASFLSELGASETKTGLFMTLTLAGDTVISFCLTLVADSLGRRVILGVGALLMIGSGVVFAVASNYWILLLAAILGVITPSGNETGPFRAVEESTIAHLTTMRHRAAVFAWYTLVGVLGSALGMVCCGWITTTLVDHQGWLAIDTYRLVFYAYAGTGLVKLFLTLLLSKSCEVDESPTGPTSAETQPLLADRDAPLVAKPRTSLIPHVSPESRAVLLQFCLLFALNSFASSLAPLSWVTYYFQSHFALRTSTLGTLFSITSLLSAALILAAASLARRIGNVRTMVFSQLPSSLCLAVLGFPTQLPLALGLLSIRSSTQNMDTAPRSAFLAGAVLPGERTAVMGTVNVVKTVAQSFGPVITGLLAERDLWWVTFLLAGGLKATYDLAFLVVFDRREEMEEGEERRQVDDVRQ